MGLAPTPDNAAEIAGMLIPFVETNYGVALDYSIQSLGQIDGVIDDLRQDHKFEDLQPLLFSVGCYVGEVLVRHAQATWRTPGSVGMASVASSPIVVVMPDGRGCNPVGKTYKRFQNGPEDSLACFYDVMVNAPPAALGKKRE